MQQGRATPPRAPALVTKRIPSDVLDTDFILTCDPGPFTRDYQAETGSSVPLTSPYAVARGADRGMIAQVKYDVLMPDRLDLVFTAARLVLVRTGTANAGIFTNSVVYEMPYAADGGVVEKLPKYADLQSLTEIGLRFYKTSCGAQAVP